MARLTVVETLKAALKKFRNGKAWTQGTLAKDKDGNTVPPKSKRAVSFCALGAVEAVGGRVEAARRCLNGVAPYGDVIGFNDNGNRTFPEIKDLFKNAIKSAKAAA